MQSLPWSIVFYMRPLKWLIICSGHWYVGISTNMTFTLHYHHAFLTLSYMRCRVLMICEICCRVLMICEIYTILILCKLGDDYFVNWVDNLILLDLLSNVVWWILTNYGVWGTVLKTCPCLLCCFVSPMFQLFGILYS